MGIKEINKFLKVFAPKAFFELPITALRGKRIAIDAFLWLHANISIVRKTIVNQTDLAVDDLSQADINKGWALMAVNFILKWLQYGVTPVWVFDGVAHSSKAEVRATRAKLREERHSKIALLYQQLRSVDILVRSPAVESELKKLLTSPDVGQHEIDILKAILLGMGVPFLTAKHEAEQLCSVLCIEQLVAAVFTKDTDVYAYGAPLIISGMAETCSIVDGRTVSNLSCVRLDNILLSLGLLQEEFVDLCIMVGCDHNNHNNIKQYACKKCYELLKQYKDIETSVTVKKLDSSCLNYELCREIFTYKPSHELMIDTTPKEMLADGHATGLISSIPTTLITSRLNMNYSNLGSMRDCLDFANISSQIPRIMTVYETAVVGENGYPPDLELATNLKYLGKTDSITWQL